MKGLISIFIVVLCLSIANNPSRATGLGPVATPRASPSEDKTTKEFLSRLSDEFGYRLEWIGELPDSTLQLETPTGFLSDDFLSKIGWALNAAGVRSYVLLRDEVEKKLTIITARSENGPPQSASLTSALTSQPENATLDAQRESLPLSMTDLQDLQRKQYEDFRANVSRPDYIDMTGMRNSELWALHSEQAETYDELKHDANYVSDLDNLTYQDLRRMHREQRDRHLELIQTGNDPNWIDPLDGMSNPALRRMHGKQYEHYKRSQM